MENSTLCPAEAAAAAKAALAAAVEECAHTTKHALFRDVLCCCKPGWPGSEDSGSEGAIAADHGRFQSPTVASQVLPLRLLLLPLLLLLPPLLVAWPWLNFRSHIMWLFEDSSSPAPVSPALAAWPVQETVNVSRCFLVSGFNFWVEYVLEQGG
jgi:hypothetical protein